MTAVADHTLAKEDVERLISDWRAWARWGQAQGDLLRRHGDEFGAVLAEARGEVRAQAAQLLQDSDSIEGTASLMYGHARRLAPGHYPMIGFDAAAVRHTQARTWQACAWALNPDLPEVQPRWE